MFAFSLNLFSKLQFEHIDIHIYVFAARSPVIAVDVVNVARAADDYYYLSNDCCSRDVVALAAIDADDDANDFDDYYCWW